MSSAVSLCGTLQRSHSTRTSRCATTARSVDFSRKPSMPRSISRGTAAAAVSVCSVVSTRWPVSAAWIAICAVSASRISPTMITSGSWRTKERIAVAKVSPIDGLTCDWLMPGISYSTGILDGEDLARRLVEDRQHGGKRRGLAAAGRAGHHDHAVRQRQQPRHDRLVARGKAELAHFEQAAVARQQADHGALAVLRRHGGDADVELGAADAHARRAVLRQPPLGDVEAGQNLHARDQRLRRHAGRRRHRAQQAVDAHAHHEPGAERLDVNVAGAQLDRALEQIVERAHHRRAAGEIAQAFDVVVGLLARRLARPRRRRAIVASMRWSSTVVMSSNEATATSTGCAEHDFGGANGGGIGGIGDREAVAAVRRAQREDRGLRAGSGGKIRRDMVSRRAVAAGSAAPRPNSRKLRRRIRRRKGRSLPTIREAGASRLNWRDFRRGRAPSPAGNIFPEGAAGRSLRTGRASNSHR